MSRLVRLLSASTALHTFGRLRLTRGFRSCRDKADAPAPVAAPTESQRFGAGVANSIKRTASVRPIQVATPVSSGRAAVRVYRGTSGTTMVGKIDAICRMIDRCIADESAAMISSTGEASRTI